MSGNNDFQSLPRTDDLSVLAAAMNANAQEATDPGPQLITVLPGDVTPGTGASVVDAAGNVYTLPFETVGTYPDDWTGQLRENGSPVYSDSGNPTGFYTDVLRVVGGVLYTEDAKGQGWFTLRSDHSFSFASDPGPGDNSPSTPPPPPPASTGDTILILPGSGTFADSAGNVYSVDAQGNAVENGVPIPGGAETGAMELAGGEVWGQDVNTKIWWTWNQQVWTQTSGSPPSAGASPPPPPSPSGPTDEFVLSAGDTASAVLGHGTGGMDFVGGGSLDVRSSGQAVDYFFHTSSGMLTVEDFASSKGDLLNVDRSLQASMNTVTDGSGGTLLSFGAGHSIDLLGVPNFAGAHFV